MSQSVRQSGMVIADRCQAASRICRIPENRSRHYHFLTRPKQQSVGQTAGLSINPCTFVLYEKTFVCPLQLKHCQPYSKSSSLESLVGDGQQAPGSVASCEFVDIKREIAVLFFPRPFSNLQYPAQHLVKLRYPRLCFSLSFLTAHVMDWCFTKSLLRTRQSLHLINLQASDCVKILNHPTLVCVVAVEDFLVAFNI